MKPEMKFVTRIGKFALLFGTFVLLGSLSAMAALGDEGGPKKTAPTAAVDGQPASAEARSGPLEMAMNLDQTAEAFPGLLEEAVKRLIATGVIPAKSYHRADYADYYPVVRKVEFLGSRVKVLEHEYLDEVYFGCCWSPGLELVFDGPPTPEVKAFAKSHRCRLMTGTEIYFPDLIAEVLDIDETAVAGMSALSCKLRDIDWNTYQ